MGPIESGHRETPDGAVLSWEVSDPYAMPFDGAVPFLIDWGTTPHPATTAPPAGTLIGFRIEHPEPPRVGVVLDALGVEVEVTRATVTGLLAEIRTRDGRTVELT